MAEVKLGGAAPLYSAHLGHLRLVSVYNVSINMRGLGDRKQRPTHVTDLTAMSTPALQRKEMVRYATRGKGNVLTVVSAFTTLLICIGVPPSLISLAFFLWRRLSWFFFILAISSSNLERFHERWVLIALDIKNSIPLLRPRILVNITCGSQSVC